MFKKKNDLYRKALEKYAGKHLLSLIEKNMDGQLTLQGEIKNLTVCFYNIFDYATLKANFDSRFLIELLYKYYEAVFKSIENNGGVVLNINGDEVISFFGDDCINPGTSAVKSCFDSVMILNKQLQSMGFIKTDIIGNGINSGEVLIGNFGSEDRMFYSMTGDNVHLARRLLNLNAVYGTNLIISDFSYRKIKNDVIARELDSIPVPGLNEPHKIYEIVSMK